jgi:aspartyl-tRNA(Asn)/glutamyl-tRNA(Gln) amidotransferase subunit B
MQGYLPIIGLEIHAELKTRTKMFCDCLNDPDEVHPNVNICPICTGHPGTLPVINRDAVEAVLKGALALGSEIPPVSKFDRKNYFYPDLPKGYQISQYDMPLARGGELIIGRENAKKVRIRRIHLEEDTARNIHPENADYSLVDFNRAGVPLMELVTEPDMHSPEEARMFAEELRLLLRYLGVSAGDMEKGEMRLEANVSILKEDGGVERDAAKKLGTKVEIKNLNSFRALEEAVRYEIQRQTELLQNGKNIVQETRGWDDSKKKTYSQRWKEEAEDYRYFPEPDLPPLDLTKFDLEKIRKEIPELPWEKRLRFQNEYGILPKEVEVFIEDPALSTFFEAAVSELDAFDRQLRHREDRTTLIRLLVNYLLSDLRGLIAERDATITDIRMTPEHFAHLIFLLHRGKISSRGGKEVLKKMFETGADPEVIVRDLGLSQISDVSKLEEIIREVISENKKAVDDYKKGKLEALQFLVGQTMAKSRGSANPKMVEEILKKVLV